MILFAVYASSSSQPVAARSGSYGFKNLPALERAVNVSNTMPEVEASAPTVAILIFDGVQIIDYSGPWDVFGAVGFNVYTVADKSDPVTTLFGQKVIADYTLESAPKPDIILLPGGPGTMKAAENPSVIKWIQDRSKDAKHVMSVCTGAFLLAKAGLLDGLSATTFHRAIDRLGQAAPKARMVYDQRYVDNGKIITTAGLSSGIDGALHLVEKIIGKGEAQLQALELEYTWELGSKHARASFADRYLPDFRSFEGPMISVDGDIDHWNMQLLLSEPASVAEVMDLVRKQILSGTPHTKSAVKLIRQATELTGQQEIEWTFIDDLGGRWNGFTSAAPSAQKGKTLFTFNLTRAIRNH